MNLTSDHHCAPAGDAQVTREQSLSEQGARNQGACEHAAGEHGMHEVDTQEVPPATGQSLWQRSLPARIGRAVLRIPDYLLIGWLMIGLVRLYQIFLSPIFGRQCRFHPTCSHYFIGAVKKDGAVIGAVRGIYRILRCNPWCAGGWDPP